MRRRTALLLALLSCLAVPASAAAVPVPRAGVRLLDCDTGDRTADFEADMRAVSGAVRLQLRFTLQVLDDDVWTRVAAPNTDLWLTAAAGRTRYVYDKRVEKLQPGA